VSGGHWDYKQHEVDYLLEQVTEDAEVKRRWPKTAARLTQLRVALASILHDMDWDFCGDASIPDDAAFDADAVNKLGPG